MATTEHSSKPSRANLALLFVGKEIFGITKETGVWYTYSCRMYEVFHILKCAEMKFKSINYPNG